MSAPEKIRNAEAAVLELSMFFVRHSMPRWPAEMAPVLLALRANDGVRALDIWGRMALLGENGLMQTRVSHDAGYRVADRHAEQQHFERLLQQALDTMNNLRLYLRSGVNKSLVDIHPDTAL